MKTVNFELASDITAFLVEKEGSCTGLWSGKLSKADQLSILGGYYGKGLICVNGETEMITHHVKTCFGTDSNITARSSFGGQIRRQG